MMMHAEDDGRKADTAWCAAARCGYYVHDRCVAVSIYDDTRADNGARALFHSLLHVVGRLLVVLRRIAYYC